MWINHSFFLECDFHFIICCIFNAHILMNYRRILLNMSNNNVLILAHFYTVLSIILWCVILLYKVEKYKNICHLQQNACNMLVDKQLERCRYLRQMRCRYFICNVSAAGICNAPTICQLAYYALFVAGGRYFYFFSTL